jgi:hypothetical protein
MLRAVWGSNLSARFWSAAALGRFGLDPVVGLILGMALDQRAPAVMEPE